MKQKTRFKNFGSIGYRPINGRYIGIGSKKSHVGRFLPLNSYFVPMFIVPLCAHVHSFILNNA